MASPSELKLLLEMYGPKKGVGNGMMLELSQRLNGELARHAKTISAAVGYFGAHSAEYLGGKIDEKLFFLGTDAWFENVAGSFDRKVGRALEWTALGYAVSLMRLKPKLTQLEIDSMLRKDPNYDDPMFH